MRMSSLAGIAGLLLAGLPLAPSVAGTAAPAPPPQRGAASAPAGEGPQSPADVYRWLEDPEMTGEGQQQPHVQLTPYASAADARAAAEGADQPSPWVQSLDGTWRLDIVRRPQAVPERFWARGHDTSGWDRVQVPHTWQSDFLDHPVFRNIPEEIYPDDPPAVPHDINPTGAYVRSFAVADDWDGRRTMLRFEGVTSGYFVWVNGRYIGYDQGGYTPAEFDVTDALHPGRNRVAVQVHRWGSGSYLEDVDQWRYSGMFRDVWMYSTPDTRITDAYVTTDVSDDTESATVTDTVDVERPTEQAGEAATYRLRQTLYAPDGSPGRPAQRAGVVRRGRDVGAGADRDGAHRARRCGARRTRACTRWCSSWSTATAGPSRPSRRRSASARSPWPTTRSRSTAAGS